MTIINECTVKQFTETLAETFGTNYYGIINHLQATVCACKQVQLDDHCLGRPVYILPTEQPGGLGFFIHCG